MNKVLLTYRFIVIFFIGLMLAGCGADMSEDKSAPEAVYTEEGSAEPEDADFESAAYETESSKKDAGPSVDKWKEKAKQQLESLQDLLMLLKDPALDPAFEVEVKKELGQIYSNQDSTLVHLMLDETDFESFSGLTIESGDTMSLNFKNHEQILKAKFVVKSELKKFGETSELIEKLDLISIQEEK